MIEDYINNIHLEFPIYEAVQSYDISYHHEPKDLLKMFVKSANSYKNTPPCPTSKGGKIIPCATLRYQLSKSRLKRHSISFPKYFKEAVASLKKIDWHKEAENLGLHNKPHPAFPCVRRPRKTLVPV